MTKKSGDCPANSFSALQEMALDLIGSRGSGLYQSELRALLSIDRSKCSKIVSRMLSSGLIYREKVPASSTYLIKLTKSNQTSQNSQISYISQISENSLPSQPSLPCQEISFSSPPHRNIDSYLTEIYMLYLVRGISG